MGYPVYWLGVDGPPDPDCLFIGITMNKLVSFLWGSAILSAAHGISQQPPTSQQPYKSRSKAAQLSLFKRRPMAQYSFMVQKSIHVRHRQEVKRCYRWGAD